MARATSTRIDSYPQFLIQIAERVVEDMVEVTLECEDAKDAQRLRAKFYRLRFAYLHESNSSHPMHKKAGSLFATAEGKLLRMMPSMYQPDQLKYGAKAEQAMTDAKPV